MNLLDDRVVEESRVRQQVQVEEVTRDRPCPPVHYRVKKPFQSKVINRPGVAGAVL